MLKHDNFSHKHQPEIISTMVSYQGGPNCDTGKEGGLVLKKIISKPP